MTVLFDDGVTRKGVPFRDKLARHPTTENSRTAASSSLSLSQPLSLSLCDGGDEAMEAMVTQPPKDGAATYVTAEACAICHDAFATEKHPTEEVCFEFAYSPPAHANRARASLVSCCSWSSHAEALAIPPARCASPD